MAIPGLCHTPKPLCLWNQEISENTLLARKWQQDEKVIEKHWCSNRCHLVEQAGDKNWSNREDQPQRCWIMERWDREVKGALQMPVQQKAQAERHRERWAVGNQQVKRQWKGLWEGFWSQTRIKPLQDTCSHQGKREDLAHGVGGGHRRATACLHASRFLLLSLRFIGKDRQELRLLSWY